MNPPAAQSPCSYDAYISLVHSMIEEGGTTFSFGKICEKCHVKSVMRVHDLQFYWKVLFSILLFDSFSPF